MYLEKIAEAYGLIAEALPHFGLLKVAFKNVADSQDTLAALYADILQFHQHTYKFIRRRGMSFVIPICYSY